MRQKGFYGAPLEMELEKETVDTAFGFQALCAGGIIRARSLPHYEMTKEQQEAGKIAKRMGRDV